MNCKLITVCSDAKLAEPLILSAHKHGWDTRPILTDWRGFGTKLLETRRYLLEHPEITHFFFADAYDVIVLGGMEEALSKLPHDRITFSCEKACWPDASLERFYEPVEQGKWNYLNSGCYFAPRELFLALFDYDMPAYATDDQLWATNQYLFNESSGIVLDRDCKVFQSYSFIEEGEFNHRHAIYDEANNTIIKEGAGVKRLLNLKTDTEPVFIHGNGKTNMDKVIELL